MRPHVIQQHSRFEHVAFRLTKQFVGFIVSLRKVHSCFGYPNIKVTKIRGKHASLTGRNPNGDEMSYNTVDQLVETACRRRQKTFILFVAFRRWSFRHSVFLGPR